MGLMPILRTTTSFSAVTLLFGSFGPYKPVPDMTYNVFSGTLNPTQSTLLLSCVHDRVDPTSAAGQLDPIVATDPGPGNRE